MKKTLIFMLSIISIIFLTACTKEKTYSLAFSENKSTVNYAKIYEFADGRIVYSEFADIEFIRANSEKIKLSEALKRKMVTIEDIILKMKLKDSFNDGGSKLYAFEVGDNDLSNVNFMIVQCDVKGGSKNIIFGEDVSIVDKCFSL